MDSSPHKRARIPYIGDKDVQVKAWLERFVQNIEAQANAYGLTDADASKIVEARDVYITALATATNPRTRTQLTIKEKNGARKIAESLGRTYAMQIKVNPNVPENLKEAAGIRGLDSVREPIGSPTTFPVLSIEAKGHGGHIVRFHDVSTPNVRRKPAGVSHMLLFAEIAEQPTGEADAYRFLAAVTRNPFDIQFEKTKHAGMTALYRARWLTAKGLLGPWSSPVQAVIPLSSHTVVSIEPSREGSGPPFRFAV